MGTLKNFGGTPGIAVRFAHELVPMIATFAVFRFGLLSICPPVHKGSKDFTIHNKFEFLVLCLSPVRVLI
jgi:hypothetical protein